MRSSDLGGGELLGVCQIQVLFNFVLAKWSGETHI